MRANCTYGARPMPSTMLDESQPSSAEVSFERGFQVDDHWPFDNFVYHGLVSLILWRMCKTRTKGAVLYHRLPFCF